MNFERVIENTAKFILSPIQKLRGSERFNYFFEPALVVPVASAIGGLYLVNRFLPDQYQSVGGCVVTLSAIIGSVMSITLKGRRWQ